MRPLSWIVTTASVAALLLGARVLAARRVRPVPPPQPADDGPEPPARPLPVFRPAPPPVTATRPTGLSHLRGRVIVPPDAELPDFDELSVTADDGAHEYEGQTNERGEFQLHLPARAYTLTASVGPLVGTAVVRARPGAEEATIILQKAVAIEGTVKLPAGTAVELEVSATRAGTEISAGEDDAVEDGHFALAGLMKGGVYDVTIKGSGVRTVVLRGITAPGSVAVELPAPATLRGAIGFEPGGSCPIESVSIETEHGAREGEIDRHCRFSFDDLEPGTAVELRAAGGGWHLESRVSIPEHGDPEPVCLNPPCQALPPDLPVQLEVILTGAPGGFHASLEQSEDEHGCVGDGGSCEISGLVEGETRLNVVAGGCARIEQDLILVPGANAITVACRRLRLVEGIARRDDPHRPATVSCQGGDNVFLRNNAVFQLHCPRETTVLRFRAEGQPWRYAPVAPDVDPAFVELTL